jgi:hypothetical protein
MNQLYLLIHNYGLFRIANNLSINVRPAFKKSYLVGSRNLLTYVKLDSSELIDGVAHERAQADGRPEFRQMVTPCLYYADEKYFKKALRK